MKWSIVASIALASLVKGTPVDVEALNLVERAAPKAQFATFDGLTVGTDVKVPYLGLNFSNLAVQDQKIRGVIPQTPLNYAINNLGRPYELPPTLAITGSTTKFDLAEFYFGCMNEQTKVAVKCQFTVTGLNAAPSTGHQGPFLVTYTPTGATGAAMMKVSVGFNGIREAYTNIHTSDAPVEQTVSFLDSIRFTTYTT